LTLIDAAHASDANKDLISSETVKALKKNKKKQNKNKKTEQKNKN